MRCDVDHVLPIDMLSDDVLLPIFEFYYVGEDLDTNQPKERIEAWQTLVHVCRRWRSIVFASPRRLNLRLLCAPETPLGRALEVWPALPLVLYGRVTMPCAIQRRVVESNVDNIIDVLKCRDRVCEIDLTNLMNSQLQIMLPVMQEPFPELTLLRLEAYCSQISPANHDANSLLGGSAPRLRHLELWNISFPGLPNLLPSATHLTHLHLVNIPISGYISPKAMATCLSMLTYLKSLRLGFTFKSSKYMPDRESRRPAPPTLSVLPLNWFEFRGYSEYLEDLVAQIDAPQLDHLEITFLDKINFNTPQIVRFFNRIPRLKARNEAYIDFNDRTVQIALSSRISCSKDLIVTIECRDLGQQLSSLTHFCTSSLPPLSVVEHLYICDHGDGYPHRHGNIENTRWLELLRLFTTAKKFYISEKFASYISPALKSLIGGMTIVLPTLQNIFLEGFRPSGPVQEGILQFVAARKLSGPPISISAWERDSD
jgi:hypothetical protein